MEKRKLVNKITHTDGNNFSATARSVKERFRVLRSCALSE